MRAIIDACYAINYKHVYSIRLWKGMCEDEGTRLICQYIIKQPNITILELLDCGVTPMGCEFLAKCMYPPQLGQGFGSNLAIFKFDHNLIGAKGLNMLADGLS